MTGATRANGRRELLSLGALACIGCCAGPVLALLSGTSVVGLASTTIIGGAGFLVAAAAAIGYLLVRRRRTLACAVRHPEWVAGPAPLRLRPADDTMEVQGP